MSNDTPSFNGGKMYHVFQTQRLDNHKLIYTPEWSSLAAKEALLDGQLYHKIDGANGLIVIEPNGDKKIYQRYDCRSKEVDHHLLSDDMISLPPGTNLESYTTLDRNGQQVNHHYRYKLIHRDALGKQGRISQQLYTQLDGLSGLQPGKQYTVELIGRKFQQTPGVEFEAAFCLHQDQEINRSELKSRLSELQQVQEYLRTVCVEGLVVKHPVTGCYYKIRSNLMPDNNCPFERLKKNRKGQLDLPLIKPIIRNK